VKLYPESPFRHHRPEHMFRALSTCSAQRLSRKASLTVQFPFWETTGLSILRLRLTLASFTIASDDCETGPPNLAVSDFKLDEERRLARECDVLPRSVRITQTRWS